ncbi:hypothetical protein KEM56_004613, partial [Ascosphaera pollenicola]
AHAAQQRNRNRAKADEEELLANLARLEAKAKGGDVSEVEIERLRIAGQEGEKEDEKEEEEESDAKKNLPVRFEMPHPRFNAQLAVLDDTLFIYGGTYERGDQEFTFNDLYSIDLGKLNGCKELFYQEPEHWNDLAEAESDDEDEDDDEDDEDDDDEEDGEEESSSPATPITPATQTPTSQPEAQEAEAEEEEEETEPAAPRDTLPHPRPFESLREFFARSATEWQEVVIKKYQDRGVQLDKSVKELRKDAFELAETKWWDCREEVMALEDEQEEAGIGEVVNLADKAGGGGGGGAPTVGRRR